MIPYKALLLTKIENKKLKEIKEKREEDGEEEYSNDDDTYSLANRMKLWDEAKKHLIPVNMREGIVTQERKYTLYYDELYNIHTDQYYSNIGVCKTCYHLYTSLQRYRNKIFQPKEKTENEENKMKKQGSNKNVLSQRIEELSKPKFVFIYFINSFIIKI